MAGLQSARRLWGSLRGVCRPSGPVLKSSSRLASQGGLKVEVIDEKKGIGELSMQSPPVNSLTSELLTGLTDGLRTLERDGCRALLLTSGIPGIFSAGLNILEMYKRERPELLQYWSRLQQMFLTLYGTRLITVACITGAAPAGGCLMSIASDYRLMLDHPKTVIGLNESLLGLPVPSWFRINFRDTVGPRHTDLALQMGLLFPAREALRMGLVDEVTETPEELRERALKRLDAFLKVPDVGRETAKKHAREPLLTFLTERLQEDADQFVQSVTQEPVQNQMGRYLASLGGKKKK